MKSEIPLAEIEKDVVARDARDIDTARMRR